MTTRKEVSEILKRHGIQNKFSLKTIGFSDLARCEIQCVYIKDWISGPFPIEAKNELKAKGLILDYGQVYFG